jgi:predicted nucleotidyltransferase component of viral defense system
MIALSTGFGNGTIIIVFILFVILLMIIFQRKHLFKGLAALNKVVMPSLIAKDLSKLKGYEKLILGYRYWVTKNSL